MLAVERTALAGETGGGWTAMLLLAAPPLALSAYAAEGTRGGLATAVAAAAAVATAALAAHVVRLDLAWRRDHRARLAELDRRRARAVASLEAAP